MSFPVNKRNNIDNKTSPLKVVSPIIRKYDGHRQKRNKISVKAESCETSLHSTSRNLKALLPKTVDGEEVILEPELISAVNPNSNSTITTAHLPEEIALPVKEICAIARLATEEAKHNVEKPGTVRHPRKRVLSSASTKKKWIKQGKIIESALEVLKPEAPSATAAREEAYAGNYFQKVKTTLGEANQHTFNQFCILLSELETKAKSVVQLYKDFTVLFSSYPDLIEDFIPFLTPEQAVECGVFMEYLLLTKMADFLALIEMHFAKTPYQVKRIHTALEKLAKQTDVAMKEVTLTILPLLKGNSVLTDYFLELLPQGRPPDHLLTDYEELDEEALSDGSENDEPWERIEVPSVRDPYGGDTCICSCHDVENEKFRARLQHCIPCSTKFINGKIFIQSGKFLRRASVLFKCRDMQYHRERLILQKTERRKRKRSTSHGKDGSSPSKTHYISSDDHKSDFEDDEKIKIRAGKCQKLIRCRKAVNDLMGSAKNIEKDVANLATDVKPNLQLKPDHQLLSPGKVNLEASEVNEPLPAVTDTASILPASDTVIYLTPSEAESLGVKSSNSPPVEDSKETIEMLSDILMGGSQNQSLPELISIKKEPESSEESSVTSRLSPPVISLPESTVIPPEVNPLLTVIESSPESKNHSRIEGEDGLPWKIEEDRVILQTFQSEICCEETFSKISKVLPARSAADVKKRFQELLDILQKMKVEGGE